MTWNLSDPQSNESSKIRWEIVEYTYGRGLDLGCGQFKAYPHFIGVDNGHHWGMKGVDVHVDTCEDLSLFASQSMDFVYSSHLIEHLQDTKKALKEWYRVVKPSGYLIIYAPHKDLYPNVGQEGANPDHKHDFLPEDIEKLMLEVGGWDLVRNETRSEGREYSFLQVYKRLTSDKHKYSYKDTKPLKTAAVCRYGAFGDLIQASSIVHGLKKQGYHVTMYTSEGGGDVIKHDPNLDKIIIQAKDQIPNHMLGEFWAWCDKKYDKFVNLSESVEGTLLSIPGRIAHGWPKNLRHKMQNVNYLEFAHDLAELPHEYKQKFYPTEQESLWAKKEKDKIGGKVVLWSLAGSSVHKTWPHLDAVLARLMIANKDVKVVLVGDYLCKMLEAGWEKEPRVLCRSGEWEIRQSLAFAQVADVVVGSETGLLNAVGMDDVGKVVTLSHSSVENLTKHWKNTVSLEPKTSCFPCHQMHYSFDYCKRDEFTGCAQCQVDITPDEMYNAIDGLLKGT